MASLSKKSLVQEEKLEASEHRIQALETQLAVTEADIEEKEQALAAGSPEEFEARLATKDAELTAAVEKEAAAQRLLDASVERGT